MTRARARAIAMGVLGVVAGALLFADYVRNRPKASWRVVRGAVVERGSARLAGFVKRPELTIRVVPDGPNVRAVLAMNSSEKIPDTVSFHYSGDPAKEVFLEEETSSLTGALLFFGSVVGLVLIWPLYERRQRRRRGP